MRCAAPSHLLSAFLGLLDRVRRITVTMRPQKRLAQINKRRRPRLRLQQSSMKLPFSLQKLFPRKTRLWVLMNWNLIPVTSAAMCSATTLRSVGLSGFPVLTLVSSWSFLPFLFQQANPSFPFDFVYPTQQKALAEASAVPAQTPAPPLPAGSEPAVAPAAAAAVENGGIIPEDDGYVNDAVAAQAAKGIFPQDPDDTSYVNDRIVQEQQERAAAAAAAVVAEAASSVGVHPTNNMVSSPQASRREPLLQADDNDDANNLNNRNFNHSAPQNTNVSRQAEGRSGSPAGMAGDGGLEYVNDSVAQQAALGYIPEDGSEQQYVNDRVVSEQQGSSFAPPRPPSLQQTNKNLVVAVTTATAAAAEADEDGLTSAYIGEDEATSQGVAPEDPSLEPGDLTSGYVDDAAAVPPATSAATVNQGLAAPAAQSTRVDSRPPPVPSAEDERPGDYINDQAVAEQLRILEEKRRLAPALPPRADKQSTTPASAATPASPARPAQQNQRPANSQGVISFQNAAATEEESSTDPEQAVPISVAG